MKKNQLTTKSTALTLGKTKSLMNITKKLLEGKSKELTSHEYITVVGDLMWEKESREIDWDEAMEYAKNLRLNNYNDWRLPTIEELSNVMKSCGGIPTKPSDDNYDEMADKNIANEVYQVNYKAKGFASGYYWSSTNSADSSSLAWRVYFRKDNDKCSSSYVRCVRTIQ